MGRPISERTKEEKLQLAFKLCLGLIVLLVGALLMTMNQIKDCELMGGETYLARSECIEWCFDDLRGWEDYDWQNNTDVLGNGLLDVNFTVGNAT